MTTEELLCDGVPALRVIPPNGVAADGPVVLHLHGGCYTMGSAEGAIDLAWRLAEAVGGWALVPDYRLAPEHAYPAALDDVVAVYGWLAREHGTEQIVVSGECAGGGLAIAMALRLRDAGATPPAALHAVSPFCDLTLTSPSANEISGRDPWLGRDRLRLYVASYIHTADPATPLVSPANADLRGLPPLLIQAAEGEALRDDAGRLAKAAAAAGVPATLELVPDTVHSFVLFDFLPEARSALERFGEHAALACVRRCRNRCVTRVRGAGTELEPATTECEVLVAGSGPAGLTAGLFAARHGRSTIVLGTQPGGSLLTIAQIEDFPGVVEAVAGFDLGPALQEQTLAAGAEIEMAELERLEHTDAGWLATTSHGNVLSAGTVIVATGIRPRRLGVPGEDRLAGRGISHCASCDGPLHRGRTVAVVGGGDSALLQALELTEFADQVVVVHHGGAARRSGRVPRASRTAPQAPCAARHSRRGGRGGGARGRASASRAGQRRRLDARGQRRVRVRRRDRAARVPGRPGGDRRARAHRHGRGNGHGAPRPVRRRICAKRVHRPSRDGSRRRRGRGGRGPSVHRGVHRGTGARAVDVVNQRNPEARPVTNHLVVHDPRGFPPRVVAKPLAPRLEDLDGRRIYLVDCLFDNSAEFMEQLRDWFQTHLPGVDTPLIRPRESWVDDPDMRSAIAADGDGAILGVGL